jgi:hypothetical protein
VVGECAEDVAAGEAENASVGVAGLPELLIANTTKDDINEGDLWIDATPAVGVDVANWKSALVESDIKLTVGASWATGGIVHFACLWRPVYCGAMLVAHT